MKRTTTEIPNYGNWVNIKFIYIPGLIGLTFLILAFFVPILAILAGLFLLLAAYFAYARHLFAPQGKNVQGKIWAKLLDHLDWDGNGKILDIGCGSAALAIALAKKYPQASVTGIDDWGKGWEYSHSICERNARIEGVEPQVTFQKASASRIPFPDDSFDLVVSNLVFHEVAGTIDKRELLREALRVVKKGGTFTFQDLFLIEPMFGKMDALLEVVRSWGISRVEFIETRNEPFIPTALKLPFMAGTIGILVGVK
ncbi:MAG: class I SAM-dependent methyltransferase [Anaerolineales bacterium]|nr:class I SAM-dependent methyltransferase [Anaerolineales bacterium]